MTLSKLRSQSRPENYLSWQWKFSRVKFSLVRFQQIESRWGYSGTSDKIRLIIYISWPLGFLYFYSQIYCGSEDLRCRLWSLWLYSWTLRVITTQKISIADNSCLQVWRNYSADTYRLWQALRVKWNFIFQVYHQGYLPVLWLQICSDGTNATFRAMFKEPLEIQPNTNYTAVSVFFIILVTLYDEAILVVILW